MAQARVCAIEFLNLALLCYTLTASLKNLDRFAQCHLSNVGCGLGMLPSLTEERITLKPAANNI